MYASTSGAIDETGADRVNEVAEHDWNSAGLSQQRLHGHGAICKNDIWSEAANSAACLQFEYTLSAKWLELLKQIASGLVRVAVLRDAENTAGIGQFAVVESAASALGVEVSAINMSDAGEIERAVASICPRRCLHALTK